MTEPRARLPVVPTLVAALVAVAAPVSAHAEVTKARLAVGGGVRLNFGELGEDFGWGWQLASFEASLQPLSLLRGALRIGPGWWTIISSYGATSAMAVNRNVSLLQMGLGLRASLSLPLFGLPTSVHTQIGGELLRASHPVPPDQDDTYFGLAVQLGLEYDTGSFLWGVQANVDPLIAGPTGVYVLVFIGLGSR